MPDGGKKPVKLTQYDWFGGGFTPAASERVTLPWPKRPSAFPGVSAPWQTAASLGAGPFYLDEYPQPPYSLESGYKWQIVQYNEAGIPVRPQWQSVKSAPSEEPEKKYSLYGQEFTAAEIALGLPEYAREQQERISTQAWQQNLKELQAAWAQGAPGREEAAREEIRGKFEAQFERTRAEMISGLGGPADWIKRWEAEHWENPFKAPPPEPSPNTAAQWFAEEHGIPVEEAARLGVGFAAGPTGGGSLRPGEYEQLMAKPLDVRQALAFAGMEDTSPPPPSPTTPPAPSWLPAFVPSQVAGQPITKEQVATPSGQLWGATPPSVLAGLGGYAEWAGGRPLEDIYAHMMTMQPRTPVGAGRTAWRPQRQWA